MPTTEPTINDALAEVLRGTRRKWREPNVVRSETTGLIKGSSKKPDLIVVEPNVAPVVIETEILPAVTVESDAKARLGETLSATGKLLWSSIAVRLPERLRLLSGKALRDEVEAALDLEMVLFTGKTSLSADRWPQSGWLVGDVRDLSVLAQSASLPPNVIEDAVDRLVAGVHEAAGLLDEIGNEYPGVALQISEELRQEDGVQTRRMASTILTNAFVFHGALARSKNDLAAVQSLGELKGHNHLSQSHILGEWQKILKVDYWPIFDIARRILEVIPAPRSQPLVECLASTAERLMETNLMRSHDLTGAVFQKLIVDRKFLAAHYTTPASASLLIGLAMDPSNMPGSGTWGSVEDVTSTRIGDLACGTGTLLSTAYRRVGQLHEMAGGDAESVHSAMMAESLVGCDVLPAATHLTASMLAGVHPMVTCEETMILTVGLGRQPKGGVALGSLELMDQQRQLAMVAITAKVATGTGEVEEELWSKLQHVMFDVLVMNPPFIRATDHSGKKGAASIPMFGAFGSTKEEQRQMSNLTQRLFKGSSAHGNAGEASYFLVVADKKLKQEGTLALVMPLSLVAGDAWEASRELLRKSYSKLIVVSIAGAGSWDMSFSADTGMGECIVVGTKTPAGTNRAIFVVLKKQPALPMEGAYAAEQIQRSIAQRNIRRLEEGPTGGTSIRFGDDIIGYALDAPLTQEGAWNVARVADMQLAQSAYQIAAKHRIWLPGMPVSEALAIPITRVREIGKVGPYHMDINDDTVTAAGGFRGPFKIEVLAPSSAPTYPTLWSHNAPRERSMMFGVDAEGILRKGVTSKGDAELQEKAERVWTTASNLHFNADFQFNSQSTGMQFTPHRAIGGRAWPSIKLETVDYEKALTVWANTSLGLLLHWWHANKQQSGRGNIGVSALQTLPILDVTALPKERLLAAVQIFEAFKDRLLKPINEIAVDDVRHELDALFSSEVLGLSTEWAFGEVGLGLLRRKMAGEPSIAGNKQILLALPS